MIKKTLNAIIFAAALVGSASVASAGTIRIPLDNDVSGIRMGWGGASRGETTFLYKIINMNGKIGVCGGFYAEGTGPLGMLSREKLKTMTMYMAGTRIKQNLGFFTQLDMDAPVDTLTIRCRDVNIAWQDGMEDQELELESNQHNFEF